MTPNMPPPPDSIEKYRALLQNVPVMLWTIAARAEQVVLPTGISRWTVAGTSQRFVSPNSVQIIGYTPEEVYAPEHATIFAASIHPEDLPSVREAFASLFRDRMPMEVEYRYRRPDGRWTWLVSQALQAYEKDGELLADGIAQDITERKRAERQQLALSAFGRSALTATDERTLMTDACRMVVEVLEVNSATVLMLEESGNVFTLPAAFGSDPGNLRIPNDPERLPALVLAGETPIVYSNLPEETRFYTADLLALGTRAGIAVPIFGHAARHGVLHAQTSEPRSFCGREAAFVESMANILGEALDRNRAERTNRELLAKLQDAGRESLDMQESLRRAEQMSEMGALVAGVAHEVRNPLFGISATLDALENKFGADAFREYTVALREEVDRMSRLMHDLLEYGRPIAATLRGESPREVLQSAVRSMRALARQNRVTLHCAIADALPAVRMDSGRLLQVFENVLKNAIEHSPEGSEIQVSVTADAHRSTVTVVVEDAGPGFAPEDLPRIFEPFFTRRRGGTGLGLSLSRRIVDAHGGSIRASNRSGGGASIAITLPAADA